VRGNAEGQSNFTRLTSALVAGSRYRGDFEERPKEGPERDPYAWRHHILFIDEIHTLVVVPVQPKVRSRRRQHPQANAGSRASYPGTIGATTLDEYRKHLEKDATRAPFPADPGWRADARAHTIEILKDRRDRYEGASPHLDHPTKRWSQRPSWPIAISDRFLPDRRSTRSTRPVRGCASSG